MGICDILTIKVMVGGMSMENRIKVMLPEKYKLVVGDTFQLFYRGVILAPNPYVYDIVSVCEKGKHFPRYFEFTPECEGEYELEIFVYDANRNLLGCSKTKLCAIKPEKASKHLNIMCVGDSNAAKGQWVCEAYRRLAGSGGNPEGLGFDNVSFVGTCKKGDAGYEGYGGWNWDTYLSTLFGGVWFVGDHNKSNDDQHSLWKDDAGNIWKLETIEEGWLKFLRYNHSETQPVSGKLTHYQNAVNKEDIVFERTVPEKESPFCNRDTGKIDFKTYMERNNIDKIDAMYIQLGINGVDVLEDVKNNLCPRVIKKAKAFVDIIHAQLPETKVIIMGLMTPSIIGGCGANYGAVRPYCDSYGIAVYVMELNKQYEAWTKEDGYKDFMGFVNISGQFDAENGYPAVEKPVNIRNLKTEMIGTNGIHPTDDGYMQVADAAFRNMVHFIAKNK